VVCYSATEARVAASETWLDWVPPPPHACLLGVTRVLHNSSEEPYEHIVDMDGYRVQFYIED